MGFVALLFLLTSAVLGGLLWLEKKGREKNNLENASEIHKLSGRNKALSKYEGILELDKEIETRRRDISLEQSLAKSNIQIMLDEADKQSKESKSEARRLKKEAQELQAKVIEAASRKAAKIVDDANSKADEIAGDAMVALRDSRRIEETIKAMTNVMNGYGIEYLRPSHDLLDDLAEEYSHKDAGIELKAAREHSRQMVTARLAADCDYSERKRKETAIHFVLDAFNGKVESALSRTKHDNFGKLEQEILDSFNIVNTNGLAFRNARILSAYKAARLEELRLGVVVNELKMQEREEQRAIKEQMREEEKARKEFEKAIKDAAKEEKLLQDAMIKARKELENANADHRAEFERQLESLGQKLQEAEDKNKRAISMAQQTKQGHVYVISNVGSFGDDIFKIGLTRRLDPVDRVNELGDASVPFRFDIHAMLFSEDAPALESQLHAVFKEQQVNLANPRKEFFRVPLTQIKQTVLDNGIKAKWTMVAEAREYRETLAELKLRGNVVRELPPIEINEGPRPSNNKTDNSTPNSSNAVSSEAKALTKENIANQSKPETLPSDRTVPCPGCRKPLHIATLKPGKNSCPNCAKIFNVKGRV